VSDLWSQLDSAFGAAVSQAKADIGGSLDAVFAGIDVRVKTHLGPEFSLGGLASAPVDPSQPPGPAPAAGLLDAFGVKFAARLVDATGVTLTTVGSPPATNYLLAALYAGLLVGLVYFTAAGVAATFRR